MQLVVKIVPSGSCSEKHGNPQRQLNPKDVSIKKMVDFVRCSALLEAWTSQTSDKKPGLQFVSRSTRWSGQLTRWKSMGILKMTPSLYHGITGSSEPFTWGVFTTDAQGASWGEQHLEVFFKSSDFQFLFVATYLIWCPSTPSAKIVSLPTTALDGPREWNGQQHNWGHGTIVKMGKLLRFVMQINSCIDCYFETQPFHPHLSYNPKSGWVGLFQPHVDMSKLKDLSVISRTNFYIFASCKVTLETFWKQNGNFLPNNPDISSDLISSQEPICCNSHPFSCLGYFWETAWQLGLHFGIETRVFSSWDWWVIST